MTKEDKPMKMKTARISKISIIVIAMLFLLSVSAGASFLRASRYFSDCAASAKAVGNGKIEIAFTASAFERMSELGASSIRVYKSNGALVATFLSTDSGYESMMGSNTKRHKGTIIYSGTSGQQYYAVVTFYAENSGGSSSKSYTTSIITA